MKKIITNSLLLLLLANAHIYSSQEYFWDHNYTLPNNVDSVLKISSDVNLFTLAEKLDTMEDPQVRHLIVNGFFEDYVEHQLRLVEQRMEIIELEHQKKLALLKFEVEKVEKENIIREKDLIYADSFHRSPTGIDLGTSWFDLSDSEKKNFKELYIKYRDKEAIRKDKKRP